LTFYLFLSKHTR